MKRVSAIILAGGKGTRFQSVSKGQQKVLIPVLGKPLLQYSIDLLKPPVVYQLIFCLGYRNDKVKQWVVSQNLEYERVDFVNSQAGILPAVRSALPLLDVKSERVLLLNGDEIRFGFDLSEALTFHDAKGCDVTIVGTSADKLFRHVTLSVCPNTARLIAFEQLADHYRAQPEKVDLVHAGIIVFNPKTSVFFEGIHGTRWQDITQALCVSGRCLDISWHLLTSVLSDLEAYTYKNYFIMQAKSGKYRNYIFFRIFEVKVLVPNFLIR